MNNGAFGENFPYSNFHDLNMDWIIKIAKDFLDQYTNIQNIISNGEEALQNLTSDSLQQLEDKANALESLLQQWYNTHSQDIANQLAQALETLSQDTATAISTFFSQAEAKSQQLLDSWPADYSALVTEVDTLKEVFDREVLVRNGTIKDNEYTYTFNPLEMKQGYVETSGVGFSTTRRYSEKFMPIFTKNIDLEIANGYRAGLVFYSSYDEDSAISETPWYGSNTRTEVPEGALYFRTTMLYTDNRVITELMVNDLLSHITWKAINSNNYAISYLESIININKNLLDNKVSGKVYARGTQNIQDNQYADIYGIFKVKKNVTYYYKGIWAYFSCFKNNVYINPTYIALSDEVDSYMTGTFTPTQDGTVAVTIAHGYEQALFTDSFEMYASKWLDDYNSLPSNRNRVYYVEKTQPASFTKLSDAIIEANKYLDSIVYVGAGTWDLIDELGSTYVESISESNRGLELKNGIHLIFSPDSKVTWNYTGSTSAVIEWGCVFNAGKGGFIIENGNLEASNCRYVVHDERNSEDDFYTNKYINTRMSLDNSQSTNRNRQCIGGGLGKYGYIEMTGCIFKSVNSNGVDVVFYHNALDSSGKAKSHIIVKDCYSDGLMTFYSYGASTKMTLVEVCGCSLGGAPTVGKIGSGPDNVTLLAWNNTIRN